ncbi:hypothetical protein CgunFtcFv8_015959 [Champsocephalus gunnari]|uniref:Uncharacterized protein n=1 Tax=Champsocephalus gunnari TaxID=52237 RepID=A0AAN8H3T1_CHAGU|nr:hypothetical protein CgunFtcFv8_015959 [Champsocephalus gunnari]
MCVLSAPQRQFPGVSLPRSSISCRRLSLSVSNWIWRDDRLGIERGQEVLLSVVHYRRADERAEDRNPSDVQMKRRQRDEEEEIYYCREAMESG